MTGALPEAIFFDLDDTIIDDSANVTEAWLAAVESERTALDGADPHAIVAAVHEVRAWYWSDSERHRIGRTDLRAAGARILLEALSRFGRPDPDLARRIAHRYRDLRDGARTLFPGAVETLERVKSLGIKTALLTNGSAIEQRNKLDQFDLARHFDYVCIEGEFGCGKPDERVYRGALQSLSCAPSDTWMVGDNLEWDVAAPMRLGISGIWHDRHRTGLPPDTNVTPDRIVLAISELLPD